MPVNWAIDSPQRRVVLTISDPYTLDQWRAAVRAVVEDRDFTPGFGFLVDRRTCAAPSGEFVQRQIDFLATVEDLRVPHRVALVVHPDDAAAYGMARMLEIRASLGDMSIEHRIFKSIEAANGWLDAPA